MRGEFHQVAHKGSGEVRVYQLPDSTLELAIRDLQTGYVPDLEVLLVDSADAGNNEIVERSAHLMLGRIQSSTSAWKAKLPTAVDLNRFRAVTVWSPKYKVNLTTAPLRKVDDLHRRMRSSGNKNHLGKNICSGE